MCIQFSLLLLVIWRVDNIREMKNKEMWEVPDAVWPAAVKHGDIY